MFEISQLIFIKQFSLSAGLSGDLLLKKKFEKSWIRLNENVKKDRERKKAKKSERPIPPAQLRGWRHEWRLRLRAQINRECTHRDLRASILSTHMPHAQAQECFLLILPVNHQ